MAETKRENALPGDRVVLGFILMAAAMFVIPIRDGIAKYMTDALPVFIIAWGTYVSAAIVAVPIALKLHGSAALLPAGLGSQTARTLLLVASMTVFFLSIRTVPLANAISAYFVAPFVAAALAPVVLKERLTIPIIVAVVGGFIGVIIVMRPEGDFDLNILWAVLAGILFAFYMLATRLAARQAPPMAALAYQAVLGAIILTPFALWSGLDGIVAFVGLFAAVGVLQSLSHGLSIAAFRFAPAGLLAPLVYLEIVAAVIVGFVAFGDWPEIQTWIGIAVILSAGALVALKRQ
ncbi:DMT family transporter [Mesobacterium sp. TK19101]|uniref:DMT family transporter n=1 Tax=Mesobacterium hydrothermale TaxID=3111907 RepID=A0ABU6HLG1_9RHOB|nr:DMT family transporter [Mesobacterium sp. TK19101]MEC3863295.1 DMT family transporter [Mesobacterium sp. TK19101]